MGEVSCGRVLPLASLSGSWFREGAEQTGRARRLSVRPRRPAQRKQALAVACVAARRHPLLSSSHPRPGAVETRRSLPTLPARMGQSQPQQYAGFPLGWTATPKTKCSCCLQSICWSGSGC